MIDSILGELKQGKYESQKITLSKRQCACLIAHMAFCIIADQAKGHKLQELNDFSVLYSKPGEARNVTRKLHKLRCIFTYFEAVLSEKQKFEGNVIFERLSLQGHGNEDTWTKCGEELTKAQIITQGGIENAKDALQVIFSDKELGDQVLQLSATQQQITNMLHPELMLSLLFCEELKEDETVRVSGAGRYSNYKGYDKSFEFVGPYAEENNTTERQHVIMDAEKYNSMQAQSQFETKCLLRELNKAYSGFAESDQKGRAVATGRWGCGIFKGNPQLKFIIQWLAASRAHRDILFYNFDNDGKFIDEETQKIFEIYAVKDVGDLFEDLIKASIKMRMRDMTAKTMLEEATLAESKKGDEDKNLFKVLIALNKDKEKEKEKEKDEEKGL